MDGGSLRSIAFRDAFARHGLRPVWIGRERTNLPEHLELRAPSSKNLAALRTIYFGTHYVRERQVGSDWLRAVRAAARKEGLTAPVWVNFVWCVPEWIKYSDNKNLYIDTHNSEREWFTNLGKDCRNPLVRRICSNSIRYAEAIVRGLPTSATCVHVSRSDLEYYQALAPKCRHVIVPNGCAAYDPPLPIRRPGPVRLYFLGSLGVRMNQDALQNFAQVYWPKLRSVAQFSVFGSSPSPGIVALCQRQGWHLRVNLDEADLSLALMDFDALVLPFGYGAGSKLKLYDALARGKWVISTLEGVTGVPEYPDTVLVRSSADEWLQTVRGLPLLDLAAAARSQAFARQYSWPILIEHFLRRDSGLLGHEFRLAGGSANSP